MRCLSCGVDNAKGAAFCAQCGKAVRPASRGATKSRAQSGRTGVRTLAYVFGAIAIGLVIAMALKPESTPRSSAERPTRTFSLQVREVAQKFLCGCGACDVPELVDCVCPTAIEEKELIERELDGGRSTGDALKAVNDRYGQIKPVYASLIGLPPSGDGTGPSGSEAASASTEAEPASARQSRMGDKGGPATRTDVREIASRFICACRECQDHVLSECGCDHPRGAVEMKEFIAYKITQKRHTPEEIVQAVAYEYGHLRKQ